MTDNNWLSRSKTLIFEEIKEVPDILKSNHLYSLNGFRALSITYVLIAHFNATKSHVLNYIFGGGRLGVYVFFVISGFLITTLLIKEKIRGTISLKKFYLRRAFRILPIACFYLILLSILNVAFHLNVPYTAFIGALFFISNIEYFHSQSWFTAHYWSLSVEEQFYLIFPYIIKRSLKTYVIFLVSFLSIIIILKHLLIFSFFKNYPILSETSLIIEKFDAIIIGSLFSVCLFKNLIPLNFISKNKYLFHLILVPLLVLIYNRHMPFLYLKFFGRLDTVIISLGVCVLLVSNLCESNDIIFKFLNNKIINKIGILSFSIYIYNQLFTVNEIWGPGSTKLFTAKLPVSVNLALLLILSYFSYNYLEKRFLKLKEKFK